MAENKQIPWRLGPTIVGGQECPEVDMVLTNVHHDNRDTFLEAHKLTPTEDELTLMRHDKTDFLVLSKNDIVRIVLLSPPDDDKCEYLFKKDWDAEVGRAMASLMVARCNRGRNDDPNGDWCTQARCRHLQLHKQKQIRRVK
jgi:hypothetical protein